MKLPLPTKKKKLCLLTKREREKQKGTETNLTYFTSPFAITPLVHPQNDDKKNRSQKHESYTNSETFTCIRENQRECTYIFLCGCMCI